MAFSGTTYTNVSGATTAASGQTVQSAVWNNIHTDLATALTQVMSQLVSIVSFKNVMAANGSVDIWQRGAGSSATFTVNASNTAYTADRWYITTGANQQCVIAASTALVAQSLLSAKVTRSSGQTGTGALVFGFPLDTDEITRLLGNKCTLSGTIKAGANWSPASGTLTISLYVGTGAVAKRGGGFTNEVQVLTKATNLTPGGAAVAFSVQSSAVVPTTATQGEVQFTWTPVGTAGADDSFTFDDIQLEANLSSQTWTPSQYDRVPFEIALMMCKRHYQKTFNYSVLPATAQGASGALGALAGASNQRLAVYWCYQVEMRITNPVIRSFNPTSGSADFRDLTAGSDVVLIGDSSNEGSKGVLLVSTASATTASNLCYIHASTDAGI